MNLSEAEKAAVLDRLEALQDSRDEFFDRFDLEATHPLWGVGDWVLAATIDYLLGRS